jgi:hypothetical protein
MFSTVGDKGYGLMNSDYKENGKKMHDERGLSSRNTP